MNCVVNSLLATLALFLSVSASAVTVTDIYGDKDGFGTGVLEGQQMGLLDVVTGVDEEGFTDSWVFGSQTWSHVYDISGLIDITDATLSVFTGGQGLGLFALSELYIDGDYVGALTDGESFLRSYARLDVFDLSGFANLLDGSNTLEIRTFYDIDLWALDYSEISITGTYANPTDPSAPIPEPATITLLGLGLAGVAMRKRYLTV